MDSVINLKNISRILTLSSGTLTGVTLGLSAVVVPAILESKDPLPTWRVVYKRGAKIAITCILTSTVTSVTCFVKSGMGKENIGFLIVGGLTFLMMPYTIIRMKPSIDTLFGFSDNEEEEKVKKQVKLWGKMNWIRTVLAGTAFALHVMRICQAPHQL